MVFHVTLQCIPKRASGPSKKPIADTSEKLRPGHTGTVLRILLVLQIFVLDDPPPQRAKKNNLSVVGFLTVARASFGFLIS